jgi:predicted dehydrogenase
VGECVNQQLTENTVIDIVQLSLSELTQFQSLLANQRKTVDIVNDKKEIVKHAVEKDTADHIFLHGLHASGAASSLSIRFGENLEPTEPTLKWNIVGSQGQIEVTSTSILNLSLGTKIRVKGADGNIEEIDAQDGGKGQLANVERVYEAFARGDNRVASFADAVKLHRLLEQVYGGNLGQSAIFVSRT